MCVCWYRPVSRMPAKLAQSRTLSQRRCPIPAATCAKHKPTNSVLKFPRSSYMPNFYLNFYLLRLRALRKAMNSFGVHPDSYSVYCVFSTNAILHILFCSTKRLVSLFLGPYVDSLEFGRNVWRGTVCIFYQIANELDLLFLSNE